MRYVDGFLLPVPKKNLQAYRRMAKKAGKIWREHGALEYRECAGDDLNVEGLVSFPRTIKLKRSETVVFAWIVFKSRTDRDRVNAKVMKDPRLADSMDAKSMPFDVKRMVYGGFNVLVDESSSRGTAVDYTEPPEFGWLKTQHLPDVLVLCPACLRQSQ